MIATGIHRFCLIHPTLVFRPEQQCISRNKTLLGANAHGAVIKWFTCIPHSYGNDKYSSKAILLIRVITTRHSPHTHKRCPGGNRTSVSSLGRQDHPKTIVKTDRSRVRQTLVAQTLRKIWNVQDRNNLDGHTHGIARSTTYYLRRLGRAIATRRSPSGTP